MRQNPVTAAFAAEAAALSGTADGLAAAELALPTPCPPWTVAELLCHVLIAAGRVEQALGQQRDGPGELVNALGYYRPDARFSARVNADRIDAAAALAASLGGGSVISAELASTLRRSLAVLRAARPDELVRTRHGDQMLLAEFAWTRVVELAVHGLDLAAALARPPWLTTQAADVLDDRLLPAGAGELLRSRLGCDRAGLLARLTGRTAVSAAEAALLREHGAVRLALG
jgi:uncharacterized protein (TIGR03083 family)